MKKKVGLFLGLFLSLCVFGGIAGHNYAPAYAEPEDAEPISSSEPAPDSSAEPEENQPAEVYECKLVIGAFEHGEIKADKEEGHVGDVINLTVKHDLFYLVEYVKANGVNLVEDEEVKGLYSFALVEGENKIEAKFAVDKELLGEMSIVYEQASNKDWTNLFSVENVVRIVTFLLNGGLLIAMVRYFIKDKRIQKNVEASVKSTCREIIPETTKQVVLEQTETVFRPIFEQTAGYQAEIVRVLGILVKCIALMQEDTPDSRRAVLAELANLNIGDMKVIDDYFNGKMSELDKIMGSLDAIIEKNKESADKVSGLLSESDEKQEYEDPEDDGTQVG